jgi:hypothetical protein
VGLTRYVVRFREHTVRAGRCEYDVPAREQVTAAESPEAAQLQVMRLLYADAGVPPLRSLLRAGWEFGSAERYHDPNADKIEQMRERDERRRASGR